MSYQEKYEKYKNKYLDLKSKYGHLLNTTPQKTTQPSVNHSNLSLDLDESEYQQNFIEPKIINLAGGTKQKKPKKPKKPVLESVSSSDSESNSNNDSNATTTVNSNSNGETDTNTTVDEQSSSASVASLFKHNGGMKGKKENKKKKGSKKSKVKRGTNHFFQNTSTSDSDLSSESNTLSEVYSDSDFSSSELDW